MENKNNYIVNMKHDSPYNDCHKFNSRIINIFLVFLLFFVLVPAPHAEILYFNDFNDDPTGQYTVSNLFQDWDNDFMTITLNRGVSEGRVYIVDGAEAYQDKCLRTMLPAGGYGGGASDSWDLKFLKSYDELYFSYWIKFADDFDWVYGGKLPGLAGGYGNGGGEPADGYDGWSARIMWGATIANPTPRFVQYMYYADQPGTYGEPFPWDDGPSGLIRPSKGEWHHIETRIKMNTAGGNESNTPYDGIVQTWYDGVLVLDRQNVRFRYVNDFAINILYFQTYFGGDGSIYAPPKDEYIYFDNVTISTERVGSGGSSSTTSGGSSTTPPPETPAEAIEAESGSLTTPMQIVSASEASGSEYIETTTPESGTATYFFQIDTSGIYKIIARVYAPDTGSDSFYVNIDDKGEFIWDLNPASDPNEFNTWREDEITNRGTGTFDNPQYDPFTIELTAGTHTITFRGRETNSRLDYFYFLKIEEPSSILEAPTGLRIQ